MLEVTEDIIPLTLEVLIDSGDFAVSSEAILACCSSHCSVSLSMSLLLLFKKHLFSSY